MMKKFLSMMILALFGALPVQADMYQASPVPVQADGDNPVLAKQTALEQGQRQSYGQLMRRLLGKDLFSAQLPIADIVNQVQDISIQNEKNTSQSYWATVQVRFQPAAVQDYLNRHNQAYLKNEPPAYLVIPVVLSGTQTIGVEDENTFYQMLLSKDTLSDFYQMRLPSGELDEMVVVNRALKSGQYVDLLPLANRYGAQAVLLVFATPKSAESWRLVSQTVSAEKIEGQDVEIDDWYDTVSLDDAWQKLLNKMEENWRQADAAANQKNGVYYARLNEPSLAMWARDEKTFKRLKFLKNLMVRGAYHDQMLLSFSFDGTQQELIENWEKTGWNWQADLTGSGGTLTRKEVYYE